MKNLLLGLSAMAMIVGTAQANNTQRLARCMKNVANLEMTLTTTQDRLTRCQMSNNGGGNGNGQNVQRLKRELRQTREELRLCRQMPAPTPDYGETARLRRELEQARQDLRLAQDDNRFLRQSNDDLRVRLTECEGQNPPYPNNNGYFCTSSCVKSDRSTPDLRYLGGAEAMFELEAQNLATQEVRSNFSCNYGIVNVECGQQSFDNANYCVAGCVNSDRVTVDMRYTKGASGRSATEAGYKAMKDVKKSFSCNYGIKIQNCN